MLSKVAADMNIICYYAHSYRKPDVAVVEFFGDLLRSEGIVPSLDPPSDRLNSAKPERHLGFTDGMVAVLTVREGGVSQYILYEISLCLRGRKPLLVFVEDTLPSGIIPPRVLQRRFSRRGLLREIRDHRYALTALKTYIGSDPPPIYEPNIDQRQCVVCGGEILKKAVRDLIEEKLAGRGYSPRFLTPDIAQCCYDDELREGLRGPNLALSFITSQSLGAAFVTGKLHASLVPSILLSSDPGFHFSPKVPQEYQVRIVQVDDPMALWQDIQTEISIFEEEYVDLPDQTSVENYAKLLMAEPYSGGEYSSDARSRFIREVHVGDNINISGGQVGAVGKQATGTITNYDKVWQQTGGAVNLAAAASELAQLRTELRKRADSTEQDKAVAAVAEAEDEAKKSNGPGMLEKLAKAGKWALDVATEIGSKVAVEAIKASLGL